MATTRPNYRDTRKPTVVCVYTIAQESRHLIIENIPTLGSIQDFIHHCTQFGEVTGYTMLDNHASSTSETDVMWIQYGTIREARYAKRKMDDKVYLHHILRVNYAPEYESIQDVRDKFQDRFQAVHNKLGGGSNRRQEKGRKEVDESQHEDYTIKRSIEQVSGPSIERKRPQQRRRI